MFDQSDFLRRLAIDVARYGGLVPLARPLIGAVGAILMLHRVTAEPPKPLGLNRHLAVTPKFLDRLLADMKRSGFLFVSMDEVVERLQAGRTRERFAAVTADDAYRDNLLEALPVFEKHEVPFTVYVAPGLIDGTADLWWDVLEDIVSSSPHIEVELGGRKEVLASATMAQKMAAATRLMQLLTLEIPEENRRQLLRRLARQAGVDLDAPRRRTLMDWNELRMLAAHPLATIGARTVHHYNLKRLSPQLAKAEMLDSVTLIRDELGVEARHFAYPYGYKEAVGPREVAVAAEAGFLSAVTTRHGILCKEHAAHLLSLPRISVNGRFQNVAHLRTMLSGFTTPLANRGKRLVTV